MSSRRATAKVPQEIARLVALGLVEPRPTSRQISWDQRQVVLEQKAMAKYQPRISTTQETSNPAVTVQTKSFWPPELLPLIESLRQQAKSKRWGPFPPDK